MESIMLPSPVDVLHHTSPLQEKEALSSKNQTRLSTISTACENSCNWGRRNHHGSWLHSLGCLGVMCLAPLLIIYYFITLNHFQGSISLSSKLLLEIGPFSFFRIYFPQASSKATFGYTVWYLFQVALYLGLPGQISTGQLTPAGNLLKYKTNGLSAWIVTHVLYLGLSWIGILDPAILAKNWEGLVVAANVWGFILTGIAFLKACYFPTHERDRKFSGSRIYDMYMGIELNPRIGEKFDFKLFTNGRPGIVAWTLIDFSFIAYQYQLHGYITNSILISTLLHTFYVVDFFINEDWYLRTIDICHDHFGFYLAWGSSIWLPFMYTLQTQYLAQNPYSLSTPLATLITVLGLSGYVLFRSVNHQKDLARRTRGDCKIWGKPAKILKVRYKTKDGEEHQSLLLVSGFWGWARHVNYAGDLLLSAMMCAAAGGGGDLLPWTYLIFMGVLLVHRCWRDEERCREKYGPGWIEYCKTVRWVIFPGIY
ncbi:hypothetical protein HYFRA_00010759 [Hymenoscyphus fraxineus]|uniref:7-dehydrocholesterol reductase n=1 Tax=Hymenoscyphus fraxineus TaxID=746836 RepID=A0A9N9PVJ8_9HELO|nr:hypothetical protein HYFRA_00010759 [Hymenoscyphus fraxineus]